MAQHPTLFDLGDAHKLARVTDARTSKRAAREIESKLGDLQAWALEVVRKHGPGTSFELSRAAERATNHDRSRRLPELERKGLVTRGPARRCRISGHKAAVWRATG